MSRPLFTLDYNVSPLDHGWYQYDPPQVNGDCLAIRQNASTEAPILVKRGGVQTAVSYPPIGEWIGFPEPIYVVTVRPQADFSIYFKTHSTFGDSHYLVYPTYGKTGLNPSGEFALVLRGRNLHDGSWHSLVFDIEQDLDTCFHRQFHHLNWICLRGNLEISEFLAIKDHAELTQMWHELKSPFLVSAESLIGKNAHATQQQASQSTETLSQEQLTHLLEILNKRFNKSELQTLCFRLGVDYDNLAGQAKVDKARELINYLRRRNRIIDLVDAGKTMRPDILWPKV